VKKAPPKPRAPAKPATATDMTSVDTAAERLSNLRVNKLRQKLTQALEDPAMRDQMVKAIRTMINE